MRRWLIAFAMLGVVTSSTFIQAQIRSGDGRLSGTIRGQVRYEDGRWADHVVVRLRSEAVSFQTEVTTDRDGKFSFDGLNPTTYHLTI